MLTELRRSILREHDFVKNDVPYLYKNIFKNPTDYLSWNDVEHCVNTPEFYNFELVDNNGDKFDIRYFHYQRKSWVERPVAHKKQVIDAVNQGNTLVITNYGFHNQKTRDLCGLFESMFDVYSNLHVYCGLGSSSSFKIHDDYPANFIMQVEGKTHWKVFKNRLSYLYRTGYSYSNISEEELEVAVDTVLEPGDVLYIPSRCYHMATPTEKRLSLSIPCWMKYPDDNENKLFDRNYYRLEV
jgi:hypothetical protein